VRTVGISLLIFGVALVLFGAALLRSSTMAWTAGLFSVIVGGFTAWWGLKCLRDTPHH
jgi:hypothetical protein